MAKNRILGALLIASLQLGGAGTAAADGNCGSDIDVCDGHTEHCGGSSYAVCCCRKILGPVWPTWSAPADDVSDLRRPAPSQAEPRPSTPSRERPRLR